MVPETAADGPDTESIFLRQFLRREETFRRRVKTLKDFPYHRIRILPFFLLLHRKFTQQKFQKRRCPQLLLYASRPERFHHLLKQPGDFPVSGTFGKLRNPQPLPFFFSVRLQPGEMNVHISHARRTFSPAEMMFARLQQQNLPLLHGIASVLLPDFPAPFRQIQQIINIHHTIRMKDSLRAVIDVALADLPPLLRSKKNHRISSFLPNYTCFFPLCPFLFSPYAIYLLQFSQVCAFTAQTV